MCLCLCVWGGGGIASPLVTLPLHTHTHRTIEAYFPASMGTNKATIWVLMTQKYHLLVY